MNIAPHTVSPEEVMAFLEGELAREKASAVSQHLEECAECAYVAEQFREIARALAGWQVEVAPATIRCTILPEHFEKRSQFAARFRRPWVYVVGTAAAASLLLVPTFWRFTEQQRLRSYIQYEKLSTPSAADAIAPAPLPSPQSTSVNAYSEAVAAPGRVASAGDSEHGTGSTLQQPMIARSVSLAIRVKDFAASRAALDLIVARYQGYPATLTANTPEGSARTLQASLRIPAPQLASALVDLKRLGRVQNESQSGEEVTQQHADLVARLKNSRETEARLQAILQQRTGKIEDVLQVEEEIARVRGEIETMESAQQALEHRVDFASIELQLAEEYKESLSTPDASSGNRMRNALVFGWRSAAAFLLEIALLAAEAGPTLLVILLLVGLPGLLLWRRYRILRERP